MTRTTTNGKGLDGRIKFVQFVFYERSKLVLKPSVYSNHDSNFFVNFLTYSLIYNLSDKGRRQKKL